MSGSITFENILSLRVSEWLVLVGCKIKGINVIEAIESKRSLVWLLKIKGLHWSLQVGNFLLRYSLIICSRNCN